MYIPDMTERFPEGMNGVDLTSSYFMEDGYIPDYDYKDEPDNECDCKVIEEREGEISGLKYTVRLAKVFGIETGEIWGYFVDVQGSDGERYIKYSTKDFDDTEYVLAKECFDNYVVDESMIVRIDEEDSDLPF